ncbi:MAG: polymer-forming cytoskeletal protein [Deltaproteobacteria bacterium]|nr:polymer-forming cytoskeletal protein [Deltaproteobacteria bacterium]
MFEKHNGAEKGDLIGFIGKGMYLEGKLSFGDTVRIDGHFKGTVEATGALVVGPDGLVEGVVNVGSVVVAGTVKGTIVAAGRVELKGTGRMLGEVRTPNLIIGDGAVFDGNCQMLKRGEAEVKEVVSFGA